MLRKRREGPATGDSDHAGWAARGLLACYHGGILTPPELSARAAEAWRSDAGDAAVVVRALSTHLFLQGKDWKTDRDVLKAVERLGDPARPTDPCSLYSLKVALVDLGSRTLAGRDWWSEGIKILIAAQKDDGSWGGVEETCAALRYLHAWDFFRQEMDRRYGERK